ncbi:MAG: hypothetical protein HY369_04935 [Candidatus Aenigmarchaeota archaeon]|nr:hypothetical protein [Candidatus Aenigmarchaeota archaeon]
MVQVPPCPVCSGRRPFCIHRSYPLPNPREVEQQVREKLSKEFFGPSYSVFVGRHGYPDVAAGPMVGIEARASIDSPADWIQMDYARIIELRSFLLRTKKGENVHARSRFTQELQELALASRPADVELSFKKTPVFSFKLSEALQPMGPSGEMERMRITENVKISPKVERTSGLPATEATLQLYRAGLDVHRISSIFASGALGGEGRKLVPSRWSVTAIDDILAKQLLEQVRDFPEIQDYQVFEAQHFDNRFVIMLMPGSWEFENFETWAPGSNWSAQTQSRIIEEYEPFAGRTAYAESQAGGYYASRISAVRYLAREHKQAKVVAFREVYEGYTIPMGVWVVRGVSEQAFQQQPQRFATKEEALAYAATRLRVPMAAYRKKSVILRQRRLFEF